MHQVCLTISHTNESWLISRDDLLAQVKALGGVHASFIKHSRLYLNFAVPKTQKLELNKALKEYLCELYLTKVKKEFMKKNMRIHLDIFDVLLSILVGFDRESEIDLLDRLIIIHDNMSIDGYFYFRLQELRGMWMDICTLAKDNALFLTDRDTMYELLRFLMSTIKPKIERIMVKYIDSHFMVYTLDENFITKIDNAEELLTFFIETAPIEIRIIGDILPTKQKLILDNIFDDKLAKA